jgi:hypothetical protein
MDESIPFFFDCHGVRVHTGVFENFYHLAKRGPVIFWCLSGMVKGTAYVSIFIFIFIFIFFAARAGRIVQWDLFPSLVVCQLRGSVSIHDVYFGVIYVDRADTHPHTHTHKNSSCIWNCPHESESGRKIIMVSRLVRIHRSRLFLPQRVRFTDESALISESCMIITP